MKITFNLEYHTVWGQVLYITGPSKVLGASDKVKAPAMKNIGDGNWTFTLEVPDDKPLEYGYFIGENDKITTEWGKLRKIAPDAERNLTVYDHWQEQPADKSFFSSAFTQDIFAHTAKKAEKVSGPSVTIRCYAPALRPEQKLAICGNDAVVGAWSAEKALVMNASQFPLWSISIPQNKITFPFEYKFVIVEGKNNTLVAWESGYNRSINPVTVNKNEDILIAGLYMNNPLAPWKGAGVAVPVFALRSEQSWGIGEFADLKKMIDWAVKTGQSFIQILPINDTTMTRSWMDSYPYNANSIFALHPVYLNPEKMGRLKSAAKMKAYDKQRQQLNALEEIDYEKVNEMKWNYFREIFLQQGEAVLESKDFRLFFLRNQEWLVPYAAFCYLRDLNGTADFQIWKENSKYDKKQILALTDTQNPAYKEISLHYYLQYNLHLQLTEAREYAHKNHIALKGDIPIGISRQSVDAWCDFRMFNMDCQAGAPPDDFSREGQNWGFPTYNWDLMKKDEFSWWKKRFSKMSDYFDAYRIDHILGFFRIWEIPENAVQGLLGHFSPALPFSAKDLTWFDFYFDHSRHATPYIREYMLEDIFGESAQEVKTLYLDAHENGVYTLKRGFDTQRGVEIHFAGQNSEKSKRIKKGLFELIAEVLFVEDPREAGKYHPRISAQYTYSYKALDDGQKFAFNKMYDDFFYYRHNEFWKYQAMAKLPALTAATDMLVCGEDLGMIPHCVPDVMNRLQILSLEIQRMPKDPSFEFGQTQNYPYLSVCTTSTHDMNPIRAWWEEDHAASQRFYNDVLHQGGGAPYFCEPWICEMILDQHLWSPSMLAVLPLQDWLSMDENLRKQDAQKERINVPAIPRYYWRYRMHLSLEQLLKEDAFNEKIKEKIIASGR